MNIIYNIVGFLFVGILRGATLQNLTRIPQISGWVGQFFGKITRLACPKYAKLASFLPVF